MARQALDDEECPACGAAPCAYPCPCCGAPCSVEPMCCDLKVYDAPNEQLAWDCFTHNRSGE